MRTANEHVIRSLAFSAIGMGVFAFPSALAAEITASVLIRAADLAPHLQLVRLCVVDSDLYVQYKSAFTDAGLVVSSFSPEANSAV